MNVTNGVLALLVVGLAGLSFYTIRENRDLSARLDKIVEEAREAAATSERTLRSEIENGIDTLNATVSTATAQLEERGTPQAIATAVLTSERESLVEEITAALMSDPQSLEALRGPEGPIADPELVAAVLVEFGFEKLVADTLWADHRDELTATPEVIAAVAAEVYGAYGPELRGADAPALLPEEVARAVAQEPGFASLVWQECKQP